MKVLIDTNILLPALAVNHESHELCREFMNYVKSKHHVVILNTHVAAELYSNLSVIKKLKLTPDNSRKIIRKAVTLFEPISLDMDDYLKAIDRCADLELVSGVIYDALHFQAAIKAKVDVLYTANLRDFERLMTEEVRFELRSPF